MNIDTVKNHDLTKWFLDCITDKYSDFDGRARRREFWMYMVTSGILGLISLGLAVATSTIATSLALLFTLLYIVISLAMLCPGLALSVRRLHDVDKSGWWLLVAAVPVIGILYLLYLFAKDGTPGENDYGPNPKGK